MLGQPWWYWAVFFLAVVLVIVGPFLVAAWEDHQDEADRQMWDRMYGSPR